MSTLDEMRCDYTVQEMSTSHHPMGVLREMLQETDLARSADLPQLAAGAKVKIAGYVIMKQRPPTAKGFAFITMEDEDGAINVVIRPDVYDRHRQVCTFNPILLIEGTLQKRDGTLNVVAGTIAPVRVDDTRPVPRRTRSRSRSLSRAH
jgi:error-prone DNA polymerase